VVRPGLGQIFAQEFLCQLVNGQITHHCTIIETWEFSVAASGLAQTKSPRSVRSVRKVVM
jgi:hypothetical protein